MYQVFGNIIKNPITIIVLLLVMLLVIYSGSKALSSLGTWLNFETKENIKEKLVNTEVQLDKAVEVNKQNESNKIITEKIDEVNKSNTKDLLSTEVEINKTEAEVLKEIWKIDSEPEVQTKIVETKVVVKDNKLTDKQIKKLDVLLERAKLLEGVK